MYVYIVYYHLRSTVKCERFFAQVYFSNETVSHATVSTGPMKMFRLEHGTMNVYQIVDDCGNYVTFSQAVRSDKDSAQRA